jgi:flagellar biosynthesis protein FliR
MGREIGEGDWAYLCGQAGASALVLARVLGLCLTAPTVAIPEFDWRFRLGVAVTLAAALVPLVGTSVTPPIGWSDSAWAGLSELLAGAAIGWSAALIMAGARAAGDIVAAQAGLATPTLIDPENGEASNPLARLYGLIALAVFLGLDGPLLLLRTLVESYHIVPAGRMLLVSETVMTAFAQVGEVLALALRVAAPVALALALAGIAVGWLGRAAPSLPFTTLALPLRSLIALALVLLGAATVATTLTAAWSELLQP